MIARRARVGWGLSLLAALACAPAPDAPSVAPLALGASATAASSDRVPRVFQGRLPACLSYSAAAVARFHGYDVDPVALHASVPVTARGVAFADVAAVLNAQGVPTQQLVPAISGVRALVARGMPVVVAQARSARDHALVIESYDEARAMYAVMDPAHPGRRETPAAELEAAFTLAGSVALLVLPPRQSD